MKLQKHSKLKMATLMVVFLGLMFAGCQSKPVHTMTSSTSEAQSSTSPPEQIPSTENSIEISNFKFSSATLTVKAGSTVKVTNRDAVGHSVTSDDGTSFDTDILAQGQSNEFAAPTTPGSYPFHCAPHPSMKGTLIVE